MKSIAIIGAGGFARELEWLISDINDHASSAAIQYDFRGFIVSDLSKLGDGDPQPLGDFSWLEANPIDCLAMGIGTPLLRAAIGNTLKRDFPHVQWPALVHPSVKIGTAALEEGVLLCAGTIATVNVTIERFAMVNLSCTIGHEAVIGEGSVVNPLVAISGGVHIGKRVLVGTHSAILQYVTVGDDAAIGASAMVKSDVPSGVTVVGVPARPK